MNITQAMIEQAFHAGRHAQLEEVLPRLIHCATEHSAQGLAYQGFALTKTNEGPDILRWWISTVRLLPNLG